MHRSLIWLSISAAALLCVAGAGAQEQRPEGAAKSETPRSSERHESKPSGMEKSAGDRMENAHSESRERSEGATRKEGPGEQRANKEHAEEKNKEHAEEKTRPGEAPRGRPEERSGLKSGHEKTTGAMDKREHRDDTERAQSHEERTGETREKREERIGEQHEQRTGEEHAGTQERTEDRYARRPRLDERQRTTIRETLRSEHVERITNVDFNVRVGRFVPARYHFYPLPAAIISLLPQYRGYDYVVADDDIVVIEPGTRRIVYTLPESGGGAVDESRCD